MFPVDGYYRGVLARGESGSRVAFPFTHRVYRTRDKERERNTGGDREPTRSPTRNAAHWFARSLVDRDTRTKKEIEPSRELTKWNRRLHRTLRPCQLPSTVFLPRKEPVALLRSILPILEGAAPHCLLLSYALALQSRAPLFSLLFRSRCARRIGFGFGFGFGFEFGVRVRVRIQSRITGMKKLLALVFHRRDGSESPRFRRTRRPRGRRRRRSVSLVVDRCPPISAARYRSRRRTIKLDRLEIRPARRGATHREIGNGARRVYATRA